MQGSISFQPLVAALVVIILIAGGSAVAQPAVKAPGFPDDIPQDKVDASAAKRMALRFADEVHDVLAPDAMGYSLVLIKGDEILHTRNHGFARSSSDGGLPFTEHTPMHVASTSKFITALAVRHYFAKHKSTIHRRVAPYLPDYWTLGAGVADVTFADLMRHTSGLQCDQPSAGPVDYAAARTAIARGLVNGCKRGRAKYKNINYTLLRIALATFVASNAYDPIDPETVGRFESRCDDLALPSERRDCRWNYETMTRYEALVQSAVFLPSNVFYASGNPRAGSAYSYKDGRTEKGRPADEEFLERSEIGPIGWYVTPMEMARVGRVLLDGSDAVVTKNMLDNMAVNDRGLSIQEDSAGNDLPLRGAGGSWGRTLSSGEQGRVKNWIFLGPNSTVMVLFANADVENDAMIRAYMKFPFGALN